MESLALNDDLGGPAGMMPRDIVLIGVPTNSSGMTAGVARAPRALRQRGLSAALAGRPGFTDMGDLPLPAPQPRRGPSGLIAVLATSEFPAVDYPQHGGLTWQQLSHLTSAALAAGGCAGWSVCIYNPDLDPGRRGADDIISYVTQAITTAGHPGSGGRLGMPELPWPGDVPREGSGNRRDGRVV